MNLPRLAIVGPFTWEPFVARLQEALGSWGLPEEVVGFGFGRDVQVWAGNDPDFEERPPRGVVVMPDARALFAKLLADPRAEFDVLDLGRRTADHLAQAVRGAGTRHPGIACVLCMAAPPLPNSGDGLADADLDPFSAALAAFNGRLRELCRAEPGWTIFDRIRLGALWGEARLFDARLDCLARFPGSAEGMTLLAERLAAHWAAVCGRMRKVLALDCDNTLWGGVVGEDGVDGVQIGSDGLGRAYAAFQQALLVLESRGVLLTLCSRNNQADVEEVFARRPEMALPRDRIVAAHVGWGAKSDGLRALSHQLGLGLDAFVFIDDNPAEREQVRLALPEVAVPEFPRDTAELPAFGYELGWRYFYRVRPGEEDRFRTEQYRDRMVFEEHRRDSERDGTFLQSLEMRSVLTCNSRDLVARGAQLTQKTNQFNLTLRRYTEAEMHQRISSPRHRVFAASLRDRFGDHGWTALAIFERHNRPACWRLDIFLISCRVLGRGFESAFLDACVSWLRGEEMLPVLVDYLPGPRNQPAASFAEQSGFRLVSTDPDGRKRYELHPAEQVRRAHEWIQFTCQMENKCTTS
jgi:FkbH-like protein